MSRPPRRSSSRPSDAAQRRTGEVADQQGVGRVLEAGVAHADLEQLGIRRPPPRPDRRRRRRWSQERAGVGRPRSAVPGGASTRTGARGRSCSAARRPGPGAPGRRPPVAHRPGPVGWDRAGPAARRPGPVARGPWGPAAPARPARRGSAGAGSAAAGSAGAAPAGAVGVVTVATGPTSQDRSAMATGSRAPEAGVRHAAHRGAVARARPAVAAWPTPPAPPDRWPGP